MENKEEKICRCCKVPKPVTDRFFCRNAQNPDGFLNACKDCNREIQRKQRKGKNGEKDFAHMPDGNWIYC